ncbi:hypothetical protein D1871_02885 [Nakamurella silvestris]|nr:hypothetical protein D1871_02885 [Nakamurella silvestris]
MAKADVAEAISVPVADFVASGTTVAAVPVKLSYAIIERFSEGLYSSPNKAFEELVTNSYDAGASQVRVFLPADLSEPTSSIVVVDNGTSMTLNGLFDLWLIGESTKRSESANRSRPPVGKFGIGKLATYVLAHQLTYVACVNNSYHAVTMDYRFAPEIAREHNEQANLELEVKELSKEEALQAVQNAIIATGHDQIPCIQSLANEPSWTAAVMTSLRESAGKIERGRLRWILETALPLNQDFRLDYDGVELQSSKAKGKRVWTFIIGESEGQLPAKSNPDRKWGPSEALTHKTAQGPATEAITANRNPNTGKGTPKIEPGSSTMVDVPAIRLPKAGTIWGYATLFEKPIHRGKSAFRARSHGFFIRVRGRLINLDDDDFDLGPELRHGTLTRFHMEINADDLDNLVASARESLKESEALTELKNYLLAVFNRARTIAVEKDGNDVLTIIARDGRVAAAPEALSQAPLRRMFDLGLAGEEAVEDLIGIDAKNRRYFEAIEESGEEIVQKVILETAGFDAPYYTYDAAQRSIVINQSHPFVENYIDTRRTLEPLKLLAMADFVEKGYLLDESVPAEKILSAARRKDAFLRALTHRNPSSAATIARKLKDSQQSESELEDAVGDALELLGYRVVRGGGSNHGTDGTATARLGNRTGAQTSSYAFTYDAKSTKDAVSKILTAAEDEDGSELRGNRRPGKIRADTARSSILKLHREDVVKTTPKGGIPPEFTLLIAPDFQGGTDPESQISRVCKSDGITPIRVADLARLVAVYATYGLTPDILRELFTKSNPDATHDWVDRVCTDHENDRIQLPMIIECIAELSEKRRPVDIATIVTYLNLKTGIDKSEEEVTAYTKGVAALAPDSIFFQGGIIALNTSVEALQAEIERTTEGLSEFLHR